MTNWRRVRRLRHEGLSWSSIARDERVRFWPPGNEDPGKALKAQYLRRHATDPREAGLAERRARARPGAGAPRRFYAPSRRWVLVAGAVVAVALAAVVASTALAPRPSAPSSALVTYCGGEGTVVHYHPLLIINVDGSPRPLPYDPSQPADVGYIDSPGFTNPALYCPGGEIHALHTHDGSGIIHVELPASLSQYSPTLGDFFQIWGEPLSSSQVWTFSGSVRATIQDLVTHSSRPFSGDPASIPLAEPSCGPTCNPVAIPPSLIFNGTYGNGDSGGYFSGEVVWLNVTTTSSSAAPRTGPGAPPPAGGAAYLVSTEPSAPQALRSGVPPPPEAPGTAAVVPGSREIGLLARR